MGIPLRYSLIAVVLLASGGSCLATSLPIDIVVKRIISRDWRLRAVGVEQLKARHLIDDTAVDKALIQALNLDTSSRLDYDTYESSAYENYHSDLIGLVEDVAQASGDTKAYRSLVYSGWNEDSQLERWLAHRPGSIKPALDLLVTTESGWRGEGHRGSAVYLLADLLRTFRQEVCTLSPERQSAWSTLHPDHIMLMLRSDARRGEDVTRIDAIEGLALVGSQDDLKLLRAIGRSNRQLQFFTKIANKQITDGKTASKCAAPVQQ